MISKELGQGGREGLQGGTVQQSTKKDMYNKGKKLGGKILHSLACCTTFKKILASSFLSFIDKELATCTNVLGLSLAFDTY